MFLTMFSFIPQSFRGQTSTSEASFLLISLNFRQKELILTEWNKNDTILFHHSGKWLQFCWKRTKRRAAAELQTLKLLLFLEADVQQGTNTKRRLGSSLMQNISMKARWNADRQCKRQIRAGARTQPFLFIGFSVRAGWNAAGNTSGNKNFTKLIFCLRLGCSERTFNLRWRLLNPSC